MQKSRRSFTDIGEKLRVQQGCDDAIKCPDSREPCFAVAICTEDISCVRKGLGEQWNERYKNRGVSQVVQGPEVLELTVHRLSA